MAHLITVVHSILTIWQILHHLHLELVSLHVLELHLRNLDRQVTAGIKSS